MLLWASDWGMWRVGSDGYGAGPFMASYSSSETNELSEQPPARSAPHTNARVRMVFIKRMLTLRRLRKASGKVFLRLGVGFGLGRIFGRGRGWRPAGTADEQGGRDENEDELKRRWNNPGAGGGPLDGRLSANKGGDLGLIFHETCRQRNVFSLLRAARQYEEQILV